MSVRKPLLVKMLIPVLAAGLMACLSLVRTAAVSQTMTISPVADAYVNSGNPSTNYGTAPTLRVDNSPLTKTYLRFSVSGTGGQAVNQAHLLLYANSTDNLGITAKSVANDAWGETALTYSNAPLLGAALDTSPAVTAGAWVTLDVSGYVKGDGTYSFGITTTDATATSFASRESGANAPKLVVTTASGSSTPVSSKTPTKSPTKQPTQAPTSGGGGSGNVLLLAGDICKHNKGQADYTANCKKTGDLVRSLLASNPGAQVQTIGDNVNNDTGSSAYDAQYTDLYAPNWGSFLKVTHAAEGNHDTYPPSGTSAYFTYFGAAAGPKPNGYYSYNIGSSWHIIVLNAECSEAGGCNAGSTQTNWLKADLAANTRQCVMAVWHQPRWTSGRHSDNSAYSAWWDLLYQYKADIVANGHNHNYERFNQINPSEKAATDGIREFIVGTGGAPGDGYTYAQHPLDPNEAIRNQSQVYGVLKLTLASSSYSWKFEPVGGSTFTDSGTTSCH